MCRTAVCDTACPLGSCKFAAARRIRDVHLALDVEELAAKISSQTHGRASGDLSSKGPGRRSALVEGMHNSLGIDAEEHPAPMLPRAPQNPLQSQRHSASLKLPRRSFAAGPDAEDNATLVIPTAELHRLSGALRMAAARVRVGKYRMMRPIRQSICHCWDVWVPQPSEA